jgi:thiol-disulfide isomerase/thioredoxin
MKKTLALMFLAAVLVACHRKEKPLEATGKGKAPAGTHASPSNATPKAAAAEGLEPQGVVGERMPPYSAPMLDGNVFDVEKERGNVVLLNLWATWCGPCRAEMPELGKLHAKYAARGFKVVGVSLDDAATEPAVRDYVKAEKIGYPIALDPDYKLANMFQASVIPTTVLIDRTGKIVLRQIGQIPEHDTKLAAAIEGALK